MIKVRILLLLASCLALLGSCGKPKPKENTLTAAEFSADSAYTYIKQQVDFGARVPGTVAHELCYRWLTDKLTSFGAEVHTEQGTMLNYEGREQPIVNIMARFGHQTLANGQARKRVLLCAHYDCRPWADQEPDYRDRFQPVMGANDGASGVGVLLEIARQLGQMDPDKQPNIDIVLFDCEDMGTPEFYTGKQREDTWCLGSQLWAERHKSEAGNYSYGILLDMVGAPDAVFPREYFSMNFAQQHVLRVWDIALKLGYGRYFKQEVSMPITDDHYYLNTIAHIPCIDIIHYSSEGETGFAHYWHTTTDDMRNIARESLGAVGTTVMTAIIK